MRGRFCSSKLSRLGLPSPLVMSLKPCSNILSKLMHTHSLYFKLQHCHSVSAVNININNTGKETNKQTNHRLYRELGAHCVNTVKLSVLRVGML